MKKELNLNSLRNAALAFQQALRFTIEIENKNIEERKFFEFESGRASVIQHFEIAYELCWKTMQRYIYNEIGAEADISTRRNLFRISLQNRLIENFEQWMIYHNARNNTSHIYNEEIANDVYQTAKWFAADLRLFIQNMEQKIDCDN